ncbi:hypothetical protein [Actinokineospora sp. NBRC 105648]|uniref:hypothetical protein n=1 Tax=Actinokineospora sp. NBRC 105648 TaxID=3032206 RepID=UPI0024A020E8|nr:hypothetical protein [Actinokineospora sp. NBRC 105648]GLZ38462.1 hypothetical protein Acsp05_20860 [Actinokineospora sp. NBRC 105648]
MAFTGKTKLLTAVAVTALSLTACNGSSTSAPSTSAPTSSAPGTGTADATDAGQSGFDTLKSLAEAVKQKSTNSKAVHVKFTGSAGGAELNGDGDLSFGAQTAMQMSMVTPEGTITTRFVDNAIYVKTPQPLQPGKPWLKLDLSGDNPLAKTLNGSLDSLKNADPSKSLGQLVTAGKITAVKPEQIDGRQATHYSITVDVTKIKAADLGLDSEAVAQLEQSGVKTYPVEVWVNSDDLPIRYITEIPAAGTTAKIQADYTNWGKAVDVSAPPAAEVATLPGS